MSKRPAPSGGGGGGKRQYQAGHKGASQLSAGMKGVLITCEPHLERKAIRECFDLFGAMVEAAKPIATDASDATTEAAPAPASSGTAGDALARELEELRQQRPPPPPKQEGQEQQQQQRVRVRQPLSVAQTGCAGNVVIRFDGEALDPIRMAEQALEDARSAGSSSAPHVVRMLPVQMCCPAFTKNIVQAVSPLLSSALTASKEDPISFAVQWRRRHNTSLGKMEVIDAVAAAVLAVAPKARVELSSPDVTISIEVIKSVCCLAVLTRWGRYKEYNLRALVGGTAAAALPKEESGAAGSGAGTAQRRQMKAPKGGVAAAGGDGTVADSAAQDGE